MRALITGGAGFIGSHLADALLGAGHEVSVIDDLSTGSLDNLVEARECSRFSFVIDSIRDETIMDRLIGECDVVFHLASAVGVDLIVNQPVAAIERCALGTEVVLRVSARHGKKTILASSSEVYGKSSNVPFAEDDDRLLGPTSTSRWGYSCSKALTEYLALAYHREVGLPIIIARLFNTIGPRQTGRYGMVVPRFIRAAICDQPIRVFGDGSQTRCFTYVSDVTRALIDLIDHESAVGTVFNIGSDHEISIMELAERIKHLLGSAAEIVTVPYSEAYENGFEDMMRRVPDLSRIRRVIDYQPIVDLDRMIVEIGNHERGAQG